MSIDCKNIGIKTHPFGNHYKVKGVFCMEKLLLYVGQVRVESAFSLYLLFLLSGLLTAYFSRSKEGFVAWEIVLFGVFLFVAVCAESLSIKERAAWLALALACVGAAFLLLSFLLFVRRRFKRQRVLKEGRARQLEFTLPDRKNEYLRERLDGVLKAREEERSEAGVKLEYVRALLARLKTAPLATVERLQTEELSRQITLYCSKDGLTAEEKRGLGDCFSALFNLSAKYGV